VTASELITELRQCMPTAPVTVYVPDAEDPSVQYGFESFEVRRAWRNGTQHQKRPTLASIQLPRSKARAESFFELVNAITFIDEAVIAGQLDAKEVEEQFADARALIRRHA
jgi:hypothetical protein